MSQRRRVIAVVGGNRANKNTLKQARALGCALVDGGYRVLCGGRGGVMQAVCEGAHSSSRYREGDTIGLLPGLDDSQANPWVDVVLPTGMGLARNALVAAAGEAVIAVGGGSGTLSEIALAWQFNRPIVALDTGEGWATQLAGETLDGRRQDLVHHARGPEQAVRIVNGLLGTVGLEPAAATPTTPQANRPTPQRAAPAAAPPHSPSQPAPLRLEPSPGRSSNAPDFRAWVKTQLDAAAEDAELEE